MPRFSLLLLSLAGSLLAHLPAYSQTTSLRPFYDQGSAAGGNFGMSQAPKVGAAQRRQEPGQACSKAALVTTGPTVPGNQAVIRRGIAYAPANAPERVKRAIWATNRIVGSRYKWGGGHGSFSDEGYDCSGTVSFALHHAGFIDSPMGSSELTRFGDRGRGRWITVYARHGHVFAVIAGLRLDTTDFRRGGDVGPRWHPDGRDTSSFEPRHIAGA